MEVNAKVKHIQMSPRKVRAVVDIIRGQEIAKAYDQLQFTNKWAVKPITKLLDSAVANAVNNFELSKENLYIKEIRVDEGRTLKRWKPRARGRATPIRKRTSHVNIVLAELVESGKKEAKKQKIEAPVKLGESPKEDKGVKVEKKKPAVEKSEQEQKEKGKKIIDPRSEGKGKYTKIEGRGKKGFVDKIFRRKSG